VSFVPVTQSFNTTSSMGRLTLNVLLSFAQFEREVNGERVQDKIAASKRKGIWVGGPVPLGYMSTAKKLAVVPEEAALVRKIFADYLRLGSIGELAAALDRDGIRPRHRKLANGRVLVAESFMVGPLAHILKNRFYIGEIVYRGEVHKGEQVPILDRRLFDAVQARLAERAVVRKLSRSRSPSILAGLIFDDRGNPMSPKPEPCQQEGRAVSVLCISGPPAESQDRSRIDCPGVGARCRGPRLQGPKGGAATRSGDSSD
jgi:site-specific DNA recombinase